MLKKILLILALILFLRIFFTIWWYYYPHRMLNITYNNIGKIELKNLDENYLIISGHDFSTPEIMIMCNESRKTKNKCNIVAQISKGGFQCFLEQFFKDLPMVTPYNRIDVNKEKRTDTFKKIVERYKQKENIILFLGKDSKSKSIFYLAKEHKMKILIAKIKPEDENISMSPFKLFNNKFDISYEELEKYPTEKDTPEDYMKYFKKQLYYKSSS